MTDEPKRAEVTEEHRRIAREYLVQATLKWSPHESLGLCVLAHLIADAEARGVAKGLEMASAECEGHP